jgi:hypothetical protein
MSHDQVGRFEQDFVEVDEIGTGEFGKVIKVRYKDVREDPISPIHLPTRWHAHSTLPKAAIRTIRLRTKSLFLI